MKAIAVNLDAKVVIDGILQTVVEKWTDGFKVKLTCYRYGIEGYSTFTFWADEEVEVEEK